MKSMWNSHDFKHQIVSCHMLCYFFAGQSEKVLAAVKLTQKKGFYPAQRGQSLLNHIKDILPMQGKLILNQTIDYNTKLTARSAKPTL